MKFAKESIEEIGREAPAAGATAAQAVSWIAARGHHALRRAARVAQLLGDGMDARCDAILFC